jgi:hypothetical protein
MAVRSEEPPVPPASLVPLLQAAGEAPPADSVIGLVRADGGAWGRILEAAPTGRLEVEARLPTQHWSSPSVVPDMVALEAPRLWTRLRRHLPQGWAIAAEVRWEAPSLVLRLSAAPAGSRASAPTGRKGSARG